MAHFWLDGKEPDFMEVLTSTATNGASTSMNFLTIHVGAGSRAQFLFGACCTSFTTSSTAISPNCSKLDVQPAPSNDGRTSDAVDDLTDSTLAEKLFRNFSASISVLDGTDDFERSRQSTEDSVFQSFLWTVRNLIFITSHFWVSRSHRRIIQSRKWTRGTKRKQKIALVFLGSSRHYLNV